MKPLNIKAIENLKNLEKKKPYVVQYYTPKNKRDQTLVFESRFESGNLSMAIKVSDTEYNLILQNDINTKGHTQCNFLLNSLILLS